MPSFSRATAAMRCIFAACAISMSEGILLSLWVLPDRILESATFRGLDYGQELPRNEKRRGALAPRRLIYEPEKSSSLAFLLALVARRHFERRRHRRLGSVDHPVDLLLRQLAEAAVELLA